MTAKKKKGSSRHKGSSRTLHRKKPCPPTDLPPPPPEKVAVPIPADAVGIPAPVITQTQRKFFQVVNKKDAIGFVLFVTGLAFLIGYLISDKEHLHEQIVLIVGSGMCVFGALMMDLKNVGSALKELVTASKAIRKSDPPKGDSQ